MQSTSNHLFKAQEAEKPTSSLSSSDYSPLHGQSPPSRPSPSMDQSKIPFEDNTPFRRSFVEEEDDEIVIPSTAVRKHLDHSQPKVSAYRRSSTSLPSTLSKAQSMDVVRQRDQYAIQDHYSVKPFDQQNSTASSPTPRKRRVSGESSKSIQSNYSNASIFGSGASINRFPQIMKSSFGSVKQFVSRSASISTSSRSRFSLRPGDKGSSTTSVLESVQEKHSPQPTINSISTPTQRGSKISRFRHRTSSIIDLSTIFTKPNSPNFAANNEASNGHSSPDVSPTNNDRRARVVPKITITNQQQNDTQKVQDPRHLQSIHRLPHPFESTNNNHRTMSTRIDEYHAFTDKPGGVGTILFGKEIADINMEDISSDVNPTIKSRLNEDGVKDASQQLERLALTGTSTPTSGDKFDASSTTLANRYAQMRSERRRRSSNSGLGSILITATLTTLHSKVCGECEQLLASIVQQQGKSDAPFPMDSFQSILDDLKKMTNMIEGSHYKDHLKQRFEVLVNQFQDLKAKTPLVKPSTKEQEDVYQSNLQDIKSFIFGIKHFGNECLSQHYQFNEHAMIIPAKGFWIEGTNKYTDLPKSISASPDTTLPDYDTCELEHYDHQATWFRTYFAGQDYLTICGNSVDNPILITIIEEMPNASLKEVDSEDDFHSDQDTQYRVIMRKTTPPDVRTLVSSAHLKVGSSAASTASASSVYNDLTSIWPSIVSHVDASIDTSDLQVVHSKTLQSCGVEQNIIRLDELGVHDRYKFGVLVVKDGQTKEEDWFANSETPNGLERFLNIVSNRVELQGYDGWSAGLDTRSGDSGTHTYISMRNDSTLAFHVSTLIPSRPVDKQHIQRKRHIGNDIVCVIFVDGRQPFNPAAIKSQFLHVFIVVHEDLVDDQPVWRVEVVANENVGKFGPALPLNGLFYNPDQLASFLHVKLINAENAALKSPKFAAPNARAREGILLNHIQRIIGLVEKPPSKKRHAKSPSTLSDPSVNSPHAYDTVVGLEFNLPDKTAAGRVRPSALPGMSRRRSTHETGGLRAKPWISRGKKGKSYGRDQGTHRRSRSELDLPVSAEHLVHENDVPLLDEHASDQADRDGIRSRAQTLFASLQQWGGRWNASPYRPNADEQEQLDGRSPSENV